MPYQIEWKENGLIWTYTETLTGQELLQSNMDVYGDPRFDEIRYQIVDMRAVTHNQVEQSHMRALAYLDMAAARSNSRIRIAVIKADQLNELYKSYTNSRHWPAKTFKDFDSALTWATSDEHHF